MLEKFKQPPFSFLIILLLIGFNPLAIITEILIIFNILVAFLVLLIVINLKEVQKFSLLPTILLLNLIINLGLCVSTTRLILVQGSPFIKTVSSLVAGTGSYTHLILGFSAFILFFVVHKLLIKKANTCIAKMGETFKNQKESDFCGVMSAVSKLISGHEKIRIFIIAVSVLGGILIGVFTHKETILNSLFLYFPLIIGNGFILIIPAMLQSLAIRRLFLQYKT